MSLETLTWKDGNLVLIDQTKLPNVEVDRVCETVEDVWQAIKILAVRGAPAIGVAAGYGVAIGALRAEPGKVVEDSLKAADYLATSRPTAVNLFWALDIMRTLINSHDGDEASLTAAIVEKAIWIHDDDRARCHAIGENGLPFVKDGATILTHCNAGGLATAEWGTALAVIYAAHDAGKKVAAFVDETRPLLQGARLSAYELNAHGVPVTLMCDNMAGIAMKRGMIDMVIVGADRIARNGDAANKIGTYPLALIAKHHGVPFYVAAPTSTFDMSLDNGDQIPIEERDPEEVFVIGERRMAPENIKAFNPAFDVTPANLIAAIITDKGVINSPSEEKVRALIEA
ncbi:MAG: S-methyl-5-thioribose-1-phosphate isomerase [Planctomycetota bacterium]|nr:S-methyl-5-thioribose-1-phosphate isomerase [Planctomycetota bacterium]